MANPNDWLFFAKNDLETAKAALERGITSNTCFLSHQAAEKSLKAIILSRKTKIPKTHDLLFLATLSGLSQYEEAYHFLNKFYTPARYPDVAEHPTDSLPTVEIAEQAVKYAEEIFEFTKKTLEENNSQKGSIPLLVLLGILLLGTVGAGAYYLGRTDQARQQKPYPSIVPTPTISTRQSSNQNLIALEKLTFSIPDGWWSKHYDDSKNGKWTNINPQALPEPSDAVPAFTVYYRKNTTVDQQKIELIDNWGFSDRKEEILKINGVTVHTLEGVSRPGFLESKKMKIAFIPKDSDLYYLFDTGILEKHETYFDQILTTFKFTQ